jgi:uncharacterized protein YdbL (DUF1318 family)
MDKKRLFYVGIMVICSLVFLTGGALADDVKTRMKHRLPDIVKLKSQGLVGENSKGYLAHVTAKMVEQDIIDAENKDRKAVYTLIAKQQGVSLERVETLRAAQIVKKANPGEFLQKPNGTWYKK